MHPALSLRNNFQDEHYLKSRLNYMNFLLFAQSFQYDRTGASPWTFVTVSSYYLVSHIIKCFAFFPNRSFVESQGLKRTTKKYA
eukprot:UN25800